MPIADKLGMVELTATTPGIAVTSPDGKVVARLGFDDFAKDGAVAASTLESLLAKHKAEPVDAEVKLKGALAAAKKSGRNVFVRFDAPW